MSDPVLVLPRTFQTTVAESETMPDFVVIEQPDGDMPQAVYIHTSQVDALIGALQRFLPNEDGQTWVVKTNEQCSMLLDIERAE